MIYAPAVRGAPAARRRPRRRPHHRRRPPRQPRPGAARGHRRRGRRRSAWAVPPIFGEIQRLGGVDDDEMARVFNLGVGMVLAVVSTGRRGRLRAAADHGHEAVVIGAVVDGSGQLTLVADALRSALGSPPPIARRPPRSSASSTPRSVCPALLARPWASSPRPARLHHLDDAVETREPHDDLVDHHVVRDSTPVSHRGGRRTAGPRHNTARRGRPRRRAEALQRGPDRERPRPPGRLGGEVLTRSPSVYTR